MRPVAAQIMSRHDAIESITSNWEACVAIARNGTLLGFGNSYAGGKIGTDARSLMSTSTVRPTSVYHAPHIFGVLFSDGSQVFSGQTKQWQPKLDELDLSKVDTLFANRVWFAALMKDKTVKTWMRSDDHHTTKLPQTKIDSSELINVVRICSTTGAFAALRADGSVVTWGQSKAGGFIGAALDGVKEIVATADAFSALKHDGTIVAWGNKQLGAVAPVKLTNVKRIYASRVSFAAVLADDTVVTWPLHKPRRDGFEDTSTQVTKMCSSGMMFAAVTIDGHLATGDYGVSIYNNSKVRKWIYNNKLRDIYSSRVAFTAISDTEAITWALVDRYDISDPHDTWMWGISDIGGRPLRRVVSTDKNFLATNDTGDVVAWGLGAIIRRYAQSINNHQASIREAFRLATGLETEIIPEPDP